MTPMRLLPVMLLSAFGLMACETTPDRTAAATSRPKPSVPVSVETEAPDPGALGEYSIPKGRCGMVLWARAGTQTVPIFQALDDGAGLMEIDGAVTALTRVASNGETRARIPQIQSFKAHNADGGTIQIEAQTIWGTPFQGGSYVKRGTLTLTGPDGWSRVVPVAGIAGCKA